MQKYLAGYVIVFAEKVIVFDVGLYYNKYGVMKMKINRIGYNHCHDSDFNINRPDGSGDYLAILLKSSAIFTFNGNDIAVRKNSAIIFQKGTAQNYRSDGGEFANDWFHFSLDSDDLVLFSALDIPFDKVVEIGDLGALSLLVKSMSYEHYSANLYKTDSEELYMKLFFIKLSERLQTSAVKNSSSNIYDKMSMIRAQIYDMPQNDWNIEWLAHQITMSKSSFEHNYKKIFGISPMNEVIASRIEHAKSLLSSTDLPVKQIAKMCGYKSDIHFMRQFKAKMHMTPSEYRGRVKKQFPAP